MTRKDFEFIAASLAEARARAYRANDFRADATDAVDNVSRIFAERLKIANPSFDRARFLAACGVEA